MPVLLKWWGCACGFFLLFRMTLHKKENCLKIITSLIVGDYVRGSELSVLCRNAVSANIKNTTPPISVTMKQKKKMETVVIL